MIEDKGEGKEGASFTITDRRIFSKGEKGEDRKQDSIKSTEREEKSSTREKRVNEKTKEGGIPLPEINFVSFILSLSTSAMYHLGNIEDSNNTKTEKNLPMAKQTIDIIAMLKEKTKGNLTKEEDALVDNILYELRIMYIKEAK